MKVLEQSKNSMLGKLNVPPKKCTSGIFFGTSSNTTVSWHITQCLRWENPPTPTTTALGVHYYALRYYSTDLGRWINRDPIGESGGNNSYGYVFNIPTCFIDPVGESIFERPVKKEYNVPAEPWKCAKVLAIISGGALGDEVDSRLWGAWLAGTGNPGVSFDEFDTEGLRTEMETSLDRIARSGGRGYANGLSCGGSMVVAKGTITRHPSSSHRMISVWRYTLRYVVTATKTCDPCCTLSAQLRWRHTAFDTTDFNDGLDQDGHPYYFEGGGFRIYDRLVNACNKKYNWGAKNFDISAEETGSKTYSWPCDD